MDMPRADTSLPWPSGLRHGSKHTGCPAKKNTLLMTSREAGQHAIALPSMAN